MTAPRSCVQCSAPLDPSENFCPKCGLKMRATVEEQKAARDRISAFQEDQQHLRKIRSGRGWILAVSILTLLWGTVYHFINKRKTEEEIGKVESQLAGATAEQKAEFDRRVKQNAGMTWEQAKRHDRGQVTLLLVVNLFLTAVYFGMWLWAKSNPFPAALISLIIFMTVLVIGIIIDPSNAHKGLLVNILVIAGLGSAVSAAYKHRKLQESAADR